MGITKNLGVIGTFGLFIEALLAIPVIGWIILAVIFILLFVGLLYLIIKLASFVFSVWGLLIVLVIVLYIIYKSIRKK